MSKSTKVNKAADFTPSTTANTGFEPLHQGSALQTQLQALIAQELATLEQGAQAVSTLWQPAHCPQALLPWLAWSQGIKDWDESWPESVKRSLVADSYQQHQYLGTRFAITNALAHFDMGAQISEWFEHQPMSEPGTFRVDVYVSHRGIDLPLIKETRKLIDRAKRKSVDYSLHMNLQAKPMVELNSMHCSSSMITIYPYTH
jgi:phage tail P2-like protein